MTTEWTENIDKNKTVFKMNALKTHVTIQTLFGSFTAKVSDIRKKKDDVSILPPVRRMFQEMWKYYEANQ